LSTVRSKKPRRRVTLNRILRIEESEKYFTPEEQAKYFKKASCGTEPN
jgi:hypothetical protein